MKRKKEKEPPASLAPTLLRWYDAHARVLPWRAPKGRKPDPWHVLLSEYMLQQTTVATVIPYYRKFLRRWPRLDAFAKAGLDEARAAWSGLGYYRRAGFLHRCARAVVKDHGGRLPRTEKELLALPGIGPYTAAAIAAIAFDRPANVMDGNIARVMARLFRHKGPRAALKAKAGRCAPRKRPGDYAQALMDLGATVCLPKNPRCGACPVMRFCAAHARGETGKYPQAPARAAAPRKYGVAFVLRDPKGRVLMRKRAEGGLLGGMWEFPSTSWETVKPGAATIRAAAPVAVPWRGGGRKIRHVFSHFRLELSLRRGHSRGAIRPRSGDYRWIGAREFSTLALPTVMKKIWKAAQEE